MCRLFIRNFLWTYNNFLCMCTCIWYIVCFMFMCVVCFFQLFFQPLVYLFLHVCVCFLIETRRWRRYSESTFIGRQITLGSLEQRMLRTLPEKQRKYHLLIFTTFCQLPKTLRFALAKTWKELWKIRVILKLNKHYVRISGKNP